MLVYRLVLGFGLTLFRALHLRLETLHPERLDVDGGAVLAITHFGYPDFALTEWAVWRRTHRFVRFMVTARAFENPVAGPLLRGMRHIPVERRSGAASYREAVAALRAGDLVGVFPEGQVNREVGPLKTGAVRMAAAAGVPLIPVVVWGGQRVLTKGRRFSLRRAWHSRIIVTVGEPVSFVLPSGVRELAAVDTDTATRSLRSSLGALAREAEALLSQPDRA